MKVIIKRKLHSSKFRNSQAEVEIGGQRICQELTSYNEITGDSSTFSYSFLYCFQAAVEDTNLPWVGIANWPLAELTGLWTLLPSIALLVLWNLTIIGGNAAKLLFQNAKRYYFLEHLHFMTIRSFWQHI